MHRTTSRTSLALASVLLTLGVGACASAPPTTPEAVPGPAAEVSAAAGMPAAIVAAADRTDADRALDAGRKPDALLAFLDLRPGMRVADLGAGGGYTTELLARAVGPTGVVYGQNSKFLLERFAEKPWGERLARPVNKVVVRLDREFDAPLPAEAASSLDVVVNVLFYHDTVWLETDRMAMNKNIFDALKPGGRYVVVDHSARAGDGVKETKTLHRIEESVVRSELEAAGFVFERSADFLKNPDDARDWNANPGGSGDRRGTSDRFVLSYRKPG